MAFIASPPNIVRSQTLRRHGWSIVFWAAVLAFYTFYFGRETGRYQQSFLFVCLLLPIAVSTTAILTEILVPKYLMRRKYGLFALYLTYTAIGSFYLEMVVVVLFYIFVAEYQIRAVDPAALDVIDLVVGLYFVVFLALSIQLGRRWNLSQGREARAQQERLEVELKLREAELSLLRAQIQPHFLFNTLNNLYGLTLEQSRDAPNVVLQLSSLLDYVLYRSDREFVPLKEEVEFLRTYIDLERLRHDRLEVEFSSESFSDDVVIAPLLLIPFVENSFKHGIRPSRGGAWLRIQIAADNGEFSFLVENSKPAARSSESIPPGGSAGQADPPNGLGLENVRRRLDLLYPGRHTVSIRDAATTYIVRLNLELC